MPAARLGDDDDRRLVSTDFGRAQSNEHRPGGRDDDVRGSQRPVYPAGAVRLATSRHTVSSSSGVSSSGVSSSRPRPFAAVITTAAEAFPTGTTTHTA